MSAKEELLKVSGGVKIIDDLQATAGASRNFGFVTGSTPECVVRPRDTQEVQKIVQWARDSKVPLAPVSSGSPHLRGGSVPLFGGVVMDLSEMNKILAVDRDYRVAMVEPGVTFAQLKAQLDGAGLRLPMPLLPRTTKSVVGSILEREPMTIPRYHIDMSAPLLCAEVIFGTGDLFRTGEASGPGAIEEQLEAGRKQKWDSGPGQISFARLLQAAQGSLGIVTWATVRCELLPAIREFVFLTSEDLNELCEFIYRTLRLKLGEECFILNSANAASIMSNGEDIKSLGDKLPPWILVLGISGYQFFPEERIAYQKKDLSKLAAQFGLLVKPAIEGARTSALIDNLEAFPEPYWKFKFEGGCSDIFFITTMDQVSRFVKIMHDMCYDFRYDISHMGVYIQPVQQGRTCHCEFNLTYDPESKHELEKVRKLYSAASRKIINEGGFFSRPYGQWAHMAFGRDAASRECVRRLKSIFDPQDIMNPGKLC